MDNWSDVTIIVPTLNEEGNIGNLIEIVTKMYPSISLIVSDDGSKDETQQIVLKYHSKNNKVMLLDRSKNKTKGLTVSVLDGIMKTKTKLFAVIDGDLQHPPKKIKEIVYELRNGNDIVVGCRNKVTSEWALYRRIMSQVAIGLGRAKLLLKGRYCRDIMSGFFGSRTPLIQKLIKQKYTKFELNGYKVLFDILDLYSGDLKIKEVYYDFNVRKEGKSKIGNKQIIAYMRSLLR